MMSQGDEQGLEKTPPASKVVKVYNGRGDVENRIKEGKNPLRWVNK